MSQPLEFHGTTVVAVRRDRRVLLAGFAGSSADALVSEFDEAAFVRILEEPHNALVETLFDAARVGERLADIAGDRELSRFIL